MLQLDLCLFILFLVLWIISNMPFVNENSSPSLAGDLSEYLFGFSNPNSHRAQQERVATTAFERQKELLGLEQQFNSAFNVEITL